MSVWPSVSLGEVADLNPRLVEALTDLDKVTFVPMAALDANAAATTSQDTVQYGEVKKGYTPFCKGDILVAKITPCFENSKIGMADLSTEVGFGSTEFHVVRPNSGQLDADYLLHILRGQHFINAGTLRMTGSGGQRRVPIDFLRNYQIALPPIEEQRRISKNLRKAAVAALISQKQADNLRILRRDAVRRHFMQIKLPHERLDAVGDVSSGITKGRKIKAGEPTKIVPFMAVSNVQDGHLKLATVKHIEATAAELERYRLHYNDILLTEGGDPDKLGRGALWRNELPESIHQNHIFRVRIRDTRIIEPQYLMEWLGYEVPRHYFLRSAKQTTGIASINMGQLRAAPVVVPLMQEQRALLSRVRAIDAGIEKALERERLSQELYASLQYRAFRGKL